MRIVADLHIHGPHSQGTSKNIDIEKLEKYALVKGINLLGTGDFTHPVWIRSLKTGLSEDGSGILKTESGFQFLLQTEISLIYSQGGKGRRVHNVVLAPSFGVVEQITEELKKRGRVDYDGRPIFGIPSPEFVEIMRGIDKRIEIIPAHAWTPWFSIFGSKSGFDSVEECFGDQTKHIHALETGMSSDPAMNWRLSALDKYALVSFSDCHSYWPWRMGREATVFEIKELTYDNVIRAVRTKEGLAETIETSPSYGKYHLDGHRACGVVMEPVESKKNNNICPKCRRPLTVGVLHRVEELADREEGFVPKGAVPFRTLIPLSEIIASVTGASLPFSKKVWSTYNSLVGKFGSEFGTVLEAPEEELKGVVDQKLVEMIIKNRSGKIAVEPGYDGVYGHPVIEGGKIPETRKEPEIKKQKSLFDF